MFSSPQPLPFYKREGWAEFLEIPFIDKSLPFYLLSSRVVMIVGEKISRYLKIMLLPISILKSRNSELSCNQNMINLSPTSEAPQSQESPNFNRKGFLKPFRPFI